MLILYIFVLMHLNLYERLMLMLHCLFVWKGAQATSIEHLVSGLPLDLEGRFSTCLGSHIYIYMGGDKPHLLLCPEIWTKERADIHEGSAQSRYVLREFKRWYLFLTMGTGEAFATLHEGWTLVYHMPRILYILHAEPALIVFSKSSQVLVVSVETIPGYDLNSLAERSSVKLH